MCSVVIVSSDAVTHCHTSILNSHWWEMCFAKGGGDSNHPPDVTDVEAPEADAAFDGPKQGTPAGDAADHKWLQVTWHYSSSFHLWRGILERYRLCHDKREGQNALIQHCQRRNVQAAVCKKKIKVLLCYLILSRTSQCTVGRQWWQWFP